MDYSYLNEQASFLIDSLFNSSLAITATVFIEGEPVGDDTDLGDSIDARSSGPLMYNYPLDLERSYTIEVYPLESVGFSSAQSIEYSISGRYLPYDRWISCPLSTVSVRNDKTLFDFAQKVSIGGTDYQIKGIVKEMVGNSTLVNVFLVKTEE